MLHTFALALTLTRRMAQYRSFLFPGASVEADALTLDLRESHHLVRVFRAKAGESVEVLDGKGKRYYGRLSGADAKAARIEVESVEEAAAQAPRVTLLQSVPKGKTMDLILRMATEIGAARVQPVFTDQGDVQIKGERLRSKVEKWRVTMIEACKQCGLSYLPELLEPCSLKDWLSSEGRVSSSAEAFASGGDTSRKQATLRLVASLEGDSKPLVEVLGDAGAVAEVFVAVGPEGDFSEWEYTALRDAGFRSVRLGANVLRAETAAAYILSVVDQCRGS